MKSRPPALELSDPNRGAAVVASSNGHGSQGGTVNSTNPLDPKSPALPTPPLAKKESEVKENFELEIEKALDKVGKGEGKTSDAEKKQPLLELSIPIGLE